MSSLKSIIGQASSQIKANTQGTIRGVKGTFENVGSSVVNQARNSVVNAAGNIVNNTVNGALGAAGALIQGDLSGATQILGSTGSSILSELGLSAGGLLSNPGEVIGSSLNSIVDNGGITPGDSLRGALSRSDPMAAFSWYAQLPPINSSYGRSTLPWYYVEEATTPFRTFQSRQIFREGRYNKYPDKYSVDGLSLGLYGDVSGRTLSYLRAWEGSIMAPFDYNSPEQGGGYQPPSSFKKNIMIHLLAPNKQAIVTLIYTQCWPTNVDAWSLVSGSSERIVPRVNFDVGDVFITFTGASSSVLSGIIAGSNPIEMINRTVFDAVSSSANKILSTVSRGVSSFFAT